MRIAILSTAMALLLSLPAAAQFAGMPGCNAQTAGVCQDYDGLTGADYENIRAYLAQLSAAGAHVVPGTVATGGTGATSLTSGGLLFGSGTSPIGALGVASNGQLPIGDGSGAPTLATITGTSGEVTVTNGPGTITLSLPAAITRDSEVATQTFGTANPPGTCTQGNWYFQTATTLRNCVCKATNVWQCATAVTFP